MDNAPSHIVSQIDFDNLMLKHFPNYGNGNGGDDDGNGDVGTGFVVSVKNLIIK